MQSLSAETKTFAGGQRRVKELKLPKWEKLGSCESGRRRTSSGGPTVDAGRLRSERRSTWRLTGKQITSYLDGRYSEDGTEITTDELTQVAGKPESALAAISSEARTFRVVKKKKATTSIQFQAKISDVDEVRSYLGRRTMSNSEIGRHTFDYFLENVVRE